jgi:signal transduction histidine kinase
MPITDPRLTQLADAPTPAWLWSSDGASILWANAAGRAALGITHPDAMTRSLADPHARQVADLATRLPAGGATRLERLRGFGARLGGLTTCACSHLALPDGQVAVLLVSLQPVSAAAPLAASSAVLADIVTQTDAIFSEPLADDTIRDPEAPVMSKSERVAEPSCEIEAQSLDSIDDEPRPIDKPLRFVWRTDPAGAFSIAEGDFLRLAGEPTASRMGLPWSTFAQALGLDPQDLMARALDARETWSGITLRWPLGRAGERAEVEMSGVPVFDSARAFSGYRGFGICRHAVANVTDTATGDKAKTQPDAVQPSAPETFVPETLVTTPASEMQTDLAPNVVPFRPTTEARGPSLSPVENNAFDEIARRLAEGLEATSARADPVEATPPTEPAEPAAQTEPSQAAGVAPWLEDVTAPPSGTSDRDTPLLDLLPTGVLIYAVDRLIHATPSFLAQTGFADLQALQQAGGLDALFIEPGPAFSSSRADHGLPLKVAATGSAEATLDAQLFSIVWDGETAHALVLAQPSSPVAASPAERAPSPPDISGILDAATDSVVLFDRSGAINSANRSAERLFGYTASEFLACNLTDLLTAESQSTVLDYFESIGLTRQGRTMPLSMTMGRFGAEQYFAVFRDMSTLRKNEADLFEARRRAERALVEKAEAIGAIRRDIRDPLNSITDFTSSMLEGRFGPIPDERFDIALREISRSAEQIQRAIGDETEPSATDAGRRKLTLTNQDLNAAVLQGVNELQAQASRSRIIIRTSLASQLPRVLADKLALRQIVTNVVANAIRLSRAGGQVIVSTTADASGAAVLRVRDTAPRQSGATTAEPPRASAERPRSDPPHAEFAAAKALAADNQAQFHIREAPLTGTLIEIAFAKPRAMTG